MCIKLLFLIWIGFSFGLFVAGGVFTVLIAVGMIPRFAGKSHTAKKIFLYEEMVTIGVLFGLVFGLFLPYFSEQIDELRHSDSELLIEAWRVCSVCIRCVWGFFTGVFIGTLAISIAEMLGAIPVFARRIRYQKGIGIVLFFVALGKTIGSLLYFYFGF